MQTLGKNIFVNTIVVADELGNSQRQHTGH